MGKSLTLMNIIDFRKELIKITLEALDKPFDEWITFNDSLHTRIIDNNTNPNFQIKLLDNELPVLECSLDETYLLVTTERVISITNSLNDEVFIDEIGGFSYKDDALNYKTSNEYSKVSKINIIKRDGNTLSLFTDSYYPFYFTNILIRNILSHKKYNKWYINPREKYVK